MDEKTDQIAQIKAAAKIRVWLPVVLMLSITALGLASVSIYFQMKESRVVSVDLVTLVSAARQRLHNPARMALFSRDLQRDLIRMSRKKKLVILSSRAVASGAPDITAELRRKLLP